MAEILLWLLALLSAAVAAGVILALFTAIIARSAAAAVPPLGRLIEINGAQLHYIDQGNGPAIVMIHGLGGQMRNFTYALTGELKDRFRVIVVDRPGSGHSGRPSGASAGIISQAKTMAGFIRTLDLEQPLLVGHSMGGAIAMAIALNHPECAGGLALISPLSHPQGEVPEPFGGLAIASAWARWLIAWTVAAPFAIARRKVMMEAVFGPETAPRDFALKGGGLLNLRPSIFRAASEDLVAVRYDLPDLATRYTELNLPVGIIYGSADRVLDAATHGKALADKIVGADFDLIDNGGHMVLVTQAGRVANFVARVARRVIHKNLDGNA
jgi:pimeloyl-ACP methyl ester carboxylesterase